MNKAGKKELRFKVYSGKQYDSFFPGYWSAPRVMKWLEEKVAQIPPECLGDSWILFDTDDSYESHQATIEIGYKRLETDDEFRERTEREQAHKADVDRARESEERSTYERLRQKYEAR